MFHVVFYRPEIPGNTGNAIRMAAGCGAALHLVEPLGFAVEDAKLRRAGLDYHDRARLHVHRDLAAAWAAIRPPRVFAFTVQAEQCFSTASFQPGDALLFGPESVGLPAEVRAGVTRELRIPMRPGIRSMNLANSAAVAVYEAWRQQGYALPSAAEAITAAPETTASGPSTDA
ncbi:tRNA (cytidine(34)-2'-O)-methyltransferase [Bounagaea algeriensis]